MLQTFKKHRILIVMFTTALVIIIGAFIVNGSEKEDLWIYITSLWLILYSAVEAFQALKKKGSNE